MDNEDFDILPNDVAIVFRPYFKEGEEWDGEYQVMVSAFGPVSMVKEDIEKLIGVASVISSVVHLIEVDEEAQQLILSHYKKFFEDKDNLMHNITDDYKGDFVLDADTDTVGGKQ